MSGESRKIISIIQGSPADEHGIMPGDRLLSINGVEIEDIFDYQYLTLDTALEMLLERTSGSGERYTISIDKSYDEDPGLVFEKGLMDEYKRCCNRCIFCFIDQMPPGMRETLYFKDDDSRLSFLQGNYVTLTNMSEHDIDRICRYHLSPINISFHTTNPELRCTMLGNRFAGEALDKVNKLYEAGITMNGQIVLCKGINDGDELIRSISELSGYLPQLESVSVVPVGLTRFREGLYPLEPFNAEDARKVLGIIHEWQDKIYQESGTHFIHASDEWYIMAGEELPDADRYDGYLQLENGVGMVRLLMDEFDDALSHLRFIKRPSEELSIVTGRLMYQRISDMMDRLMAIYPGLKIRVYAIRNDFFGENITVSGLITGTDIIAQLKNAELGRRLIIPGNMLRAGEDYLLDDVTISGLEDALGVSVSVAGRSGYELADCITASGLRLPGRRARRTDSGL